MLADATTSSAVFLIFSSGDLVAIAVAIAANVVTIVVTSRVQDREDARSRSDRTARDESEKRAEEWKRAADKRARVNAHFVKIILAANMLEAMVGPAQWKPDRFKTPDEQKAFTETLDEVMRPLPEAAASLTIEEITAPTDTINEMLRKFVDFRRLLSLLGTSEHDVKDWDRMFEDKTAIEEAKKHLEKDVPGILKQLQP